MSKIYNPTVSSPVLVQSILDVAIKSTGAQRGMIFLLDAAGKMQAHIGRHITGRDLDPIREMTISQNVVEEVQRARRPQIIEDFGKRMAADPWQSVVALRLAWSVCVPLVAGTGSAHEMRGAIYLDSTEPPRQKLDASLDMLQSLGNAVALSLENIHLYERLHKEKARLTSVAKLTLALNSAMDLDEVLRAGLDVMFSESNSHRGFLMLLEATPQNPQMGRLVFKIGRDRNGKVLAESDFSIHRRHLADVIRRGESVFQPASADDQQNFSQTVMEFRATFPSFIPLKVVEIDPKGADLPQKPGRTIGVVCVDGPIEGGEAAKDTLFLLEVLASQLATAIDKTRLVRTKWEKEQMDAELKNAESVQRFLLPTSLPEVAGYSFAARCYTTEGPGGDYYDFIELGSGRLAIVMADVSGHSVSASLIACLVRGSIRLSCEIYETPAEILYKANQHLIRDIPHGMFVTVFMAILDVEAMMLTYSNAGAPLPLLFRRGAPEPFELRVGGMPLGILHPVTYEQETLELEPEDAIIVYTDGVIEASSGGKLLGSEGLIEAVRPTMVHSADIIVSGIHETLVKYTGTTKLEDDVTLIAMKCLSGVENQEFTIFSTPEYVEQGTQRVIDFLRPRGFVSGNEMNLRLVLIELIGNAVEHGNRKAPSKKVKVRVSTDPARANVIVRDEGEGYDTETVWAGLSSTNPQSERGRGLYLIKQYVEQMRANRKGNEILIGFSKGKF